MLEREIFLCALEVGPLERGTYLDGACRGDAALRRRIDALLRSHDTVAGFLAVPAVDQLAATEHEEGDAVADLSFLAPSAEPGSLGRLDHYEILEVVGRGGMGLVLRARDTKLLRVVALKVLAAPFAAFGSARRRFAREARAAAAVRDDHVVAIHAVHDDALVPYLVMEFIDGCNLETLLRRSAPLEAKEILRIGIQVASGLAAAHKQGLIHRDVKPANIMLENGVQRVKLTDFGLARAADDASLTQSGFIAGTPLYMSPEQAASEPVDARADLFSLGSVLYEMCTGRPAFRAHNTAAVLRRICDEIPRPIRSVNPDIPRSLTRVIDRLHAKRPTDRPATAREVADLLADVLAGIQGHSGTGASTDSKVRIAPRPSGPQRRWLGVTAFLTLLLVGLGEATGVTNLQSSVLRLFSPDGALVVELDDPGVSVAIEGEELRITGAGAREIRLKPGQYKVHASKDGKLVCQELVTVTRNGRQVVRISKEAAPRLAAEQWEKSVAALPATEQVAAVSRRLRELNPRFDGKITPTIDQGRVKAVYFSTAEVEDISPVRAFRELETLDCSGPWPKEGKLSDLRPLRGMSLTFLACGCNPITDFSPLRQLPLKHLACGSTHVSDLTPLQGMRLESIMLMNTRTTDLAPLQGMPLIELNVNGLQEIKDLRPIKRMPLRCLGLQLVPVEDLSLLADLKFLQDLVLDDMPVSDLTPLRKLPLTRLSIRNTRISDLSPLKELPLKWLSIDYQPNREPLLRSLTSLEFLNDKPVAEFWKEIASKSP